MVQTIIDKLDVFNDPEFKFDPIKHKYTYQGSHFISVTQFISRFHKEFDTDFWSKKKADERQIDQSEILKEWKVLNDRANEIGTATHLWLENYFKRKHQELPTDLDVIHRINKFNIIFAKHLHKLTPIKFEIMIFSKKWKIAGMIDSLFLYKDKLYIIDYKTNKKFTTDENLEFKESLLEPFESYFKSHMNEYSIQISLYSLILKEYGIDVNGGYLLHIGPEEEEPKIYRTIDMTNILEKYLNGNIIN